jgi:hypothetical protein
LLVYIAFSVSTARSDHLFPGLLAIISAFFPFFVAFSSSPQLASGAFGHNFRHYPLFYGFFTIQAACFRGFWL